MLQRNGTLTHLALLTRSVLEDPSVYYQDEDKIGTFLTVSPVKRAALVCAILQHLLNPCTENKNICASAAKGLQGSAPLI